MKHPILIGIASVIPGFGYLLLGDLRSAVYVWLGLLAAALVYFFSPIEFLWDLAVIAFVGIWIGQLVWASREAGRQRLIASGELEAALEPQSLPAAPPPGLSRKEKGEFKMREMVKSQLGPSEKLGPVVSVMDRARATLLTSVFYLAAVDSGLVLLELTASNKPKSLRRIERNQIGSVELKKGMLTDRIRLHVQNQKRPLAYYSQRVFRDQAEQLVSTIEGWLAPGIGEATR